MGREPVRIAMWSGPRTISTALMRSWEARGDTFVCDEPLYAHYLAVTGLPHPGAAEVIASHETDWRRVVAVLAGPVPQGKNIFYQKHMSHHLLPDVGRDWIDALVNCFLIREPAQMLASLVRVIPEPALAETGLPQQVELFERRLAATGDVPPVIDAADVLGDPAATLQRLCDRIGVPWTERMLSWEPGRRPTDGVWARYWYAQVERSRGFERPPPPRAEIPPRAGPLLEECRRLYRRMWEHRIV
jgi:hypothetical protein